MKLRTLIRSEYVLLWKYKTSLTEAIMNIHDADAVYHNIGDSARDYDKERQERGNLRRYPVISMNCHERGYES